MIGVIDIETTGVDYWRNEILTLSLGIYSDNQDEIASIELKFRPVRMKYWKDEAEAVHKISKEEAKNFPDANESWGQFFDFIEENVSSPIPFVCHALWFGHYFDRAFLECQMFLTDNHWLLRKYFSKSISTHTMCQTLRTHQVYNFEKLSLDVICKHFKIELNHHEAKSDRVACAKVYFKIREKYNEVYEEKCRKEAERERDETEKDGSHGAVPIENGRGKTRKPTKVGRRTNLQGSFG